MKRMCLIFLLLLVILTGNHAANAGSPGPEFEAYEDIVMRDDQIEREVSRISADLQSKKCNISQAPTAWNELLEAAKQQDKR